MLLSADWVLPVCDAPIRDGGVIVEHGLIAEVGPLADIAHLNRDGVRRDLPGCVLLPGLVNAHTHLSLTAVNGLLEPAPFAMWLPRLVTAISGWGPADHAASAALGAVQCLEAGVTVVGDIAYGPESPSAAADFGIGGVFYWEVLGITAEDLPAELERIEFPVIDHARCGARLRCGISPHALYSCGPGLLQAVHGFAHDHDLPLAIHVAESDDEVRLVRDGSGALAGIAGRSAVGFAPTGTTPVRYLTDLGVLGDATAIHLGHADAIDVAELARAVRGAVACPRSNAFLHNPVAPVSRLLGAGAAVGLGTDSAASNRDLDLMEEVRELRRIDSTIPARTLIDLVTAKGAAALGVHEQFGVIRKGMQADLAAFRVSSTDDPEEAVVREAGKSTLWALFSGGTWRVIDGHVDSSLATAVSAAGPAHSRAAEALAHA